MKITTMRLHKLPCDILDKYKAAIKVPIDIESNSAIYITPSAEDTDDQIREMVKLIGMTKIAIVILNIDHLFIKTEEDWSVYGFREPPRNIILSKEGRRIAKTFADYLTEVNQFTEVINTPETLLFCMCHSGLIY